MTHCLLFAAALGITAAATSTASPWVVAGWAGFGLLAATAALGDWALLAGIITVATPLLLTDTAPLVVLEQMQGWIGLAVAAGCLVHVLGDMATKSGAPLLFPAPIGGETWQELHVLPRRLRLHTGKRVETLLVFPFFLVLAVVAVAYLPDLRPYTAELVDHAVATIATTPT